MEEINLIHERYCNNDPWGPTEWYIEKNFENVKILLDQCLIKMKNNLQEQTDVVRTVILQYYPEEIVEYLFSYGINPFILTYEYDSNNISFLKLLNKRSERYFYSILGIVKKYYQDTCTYSDSEIADLLHKYKDDTKLFELGYIRQEHYHVSNDKGNTFWSICIRNFSLSDILVLFKKFEKRGWNLIFTPKDSAMLIDKISNKCDMTSLNTLCYLLRPDIKVKVNFDFSLIQNSDNYFLQHIYRSHLLEKVVKDLQISIEYSPDNQDLDSPFLQAKSEFEGVKEKWKKMI